MRLTAFIGIVVSLMAVGSQTSAVEVRFASIGPGGSIAADGMIISVGQPAIGATTNSVHVLHAGFIGCLGYLLPLPREGDIDGNGVVDIDDLLEVIAGWGVCPPPNDPCPGDIHPPPNGFVDIDDLLLVIGNWD